jgi:hypothetical protein
MTQRDKIYLAHLQQLPNVAELLQRLDAIPVDHPTGQKVAARVSSLIQEFGNLSKPRQVQRSTQTPENTTSDNIFDPTPIETYLITLYGPRPWKYPLPTAPF